MIPSETSTRGTPEMLSTPNLPPNTHTHTPGSERETQ